MGCENMPARTRGCPGPIHCARCIVTALLLVAKRQRNAALHLFAIDPAFVAAVFAAHRELATHRRALLVDRAAHAVLVGSSEENTADIQSLMRIPYQVYCLKQ